MKAKTSTILVIDDAREVLLYLTFILERAGFRVMTASDGQEGLRLIEKEQPDLILCDIMMPNLNGFEFRKTLARNDVTSTIPFIFLTARAALVDKLHGIEAGADDYITKPFEREELLARINAVLRRAALSRQQGFIEAKTEIEKVRSSIFSEVSQELEPAVNKVLAALILVLTERFAGDVQQQKRFIQIALDNTYHLHDLVKEMATRAAELSQEQVDAYVREVVDLEADFYELIE